MSHVRKAAGSALLAAATTASILVPLATPSANAASAPSGFTVDQPGLASGGPQGVELSWSPVDGATGYDVRLSSSADWSDTSSITIPGAHTTAPVYAPPPDLPHATYSWQVRADFSSGAGAWASAPQPFTRAWLDRPIGLQSDSSKWLDLSWTPMADASFYEVEVSTESSFPDPDPVQGTLNNSTQTIRCYTAHPEWMPQLDRVGTSGINVDCDPLKLDLPAGPYYWRVRGRNGTAVVAGKYNTSGDAFCTGVWHDTDVKATSSTAECSLWSDPTVAVSPMGKTPGVATDLIAAPSGLGTSCTLPCADTPELHWSDVPWADFYRVTIAYDGAMTNIAHIIDVSDDRLLEAAATPDQQQSMYWTVQACVSQGASPIITPDSKGICGTAAVPLLYPTKHSMAAQLSSPASGAAVNQLYPTLSWLHYSAVDPMTEARGYRLQVATGADFSQPLVDTTTDLTAYTAQQVWPSTTLWWRVAAIDEMGNQLTWSTPRLFTLTTPTVPSTSVDSASAALGQRWELQQTSAALGGWYAVSANANDRMSFSFSGPMVRLYGTRMPAGGYADVYIDGLKKATVNFYSSSVRYRQMVYGTTIASGSHLLTVIVRGSHQTGATGSKVAIDALATSSATIEELSAVMRWSTHRATDAYNGSYAAATYPLADRGSRPRAWARMTGSIFTVYGCKSPRSGKMYVFVDSKLIGTADLYQSYSACNRVVFRTPVLTAGAHTVTVEPVGLARTGSLGTEVSVDRITAQ